MRPKAAENFDVLDLWEVFDQKPSILQNSPERAKRKIKSPKIYAKSRSTIWDFGWSHICTHRHKKTHTSTRYLFLSLSLSVLFSLFLSLFLSSPSLFFYFPALDLEVHLCTRDTVVMTSRRDA